MNRSSVGKTGRWAGAVLCALGLAAVSLAAPIPPGAQSSAAAQRLETFLRRLYAWGPAFTVKIGTMAESPVAGLLQADVTVGHDGQGETGAVYVSSDARYLLRGNISDLHEGAATPPPGTIEERIETFLRGAYSWGPSIGIQVGRRRASPLAALAEVPITISAGGQSDSGVVFLSKDARYLLRGELNDMDEDPFAANRSRIRLQGSPSSGPASASVVVVDYSDFQCPHCRELDAILRDLHQKYPQVRFVAKNFPLEQIHPWAMTAATAAVCAQRLNAPAYWKLHHAIFDNQDNITPSNAWTRMRELAAEAGLDIDDFAGCMASADTRDAVHADLKEGMALHIANTPTVFVNGRRIIGGERSLLEQYIEYELAYGAATRSPR